MGCKFLFVVLVNAFAVWCFPTNLPLPAPDSQNVVNNAELPAPQNTNNCGAEHDIHPIESSGLSAIDTQSSPSQTLINKPTEILQPIQSTLQLANQILQQTDGPHQPILAQHITSDLMSTASHYGASGSIQHEQNSYGLNQQSYGHKDHLNDSQQQHSENQHHSVLPEENVTQINADAIQPVSSQGLSGSIQSSKPTPVVADSQPSHQDSHSYDTASTEHQQSLDHQPADSADLSPTTVNPEHTNEPLISTISLASGQNQNQYGLNQHNLYGLTQPAYGH